MFSISHENHKKNVWFDLFFSVYASSKSEEVGVAALMSQEQVSNWKWIFPQRQRSSPSKRKYTSQRWEIISGFYITVKGDDDNWSFWHHPERWWWAKVLTSPSKVVMIAVATGVASLVIGFILGFFLRFVLAIIIVGIIIIIIVKKSSPSQLHHLHHYCIITITIECSSELPSRVFCTGKSSRASVTSSTAHLMKPCPIEK